MLKRNVALSGVALAALMFAAGAASAADLQRAAPVYKAPPQEMMMYNWTGFYIGANLGGSFGHADFSPLAFSTDMNGVVGGGQIGYNWQIPGSMWVFGLELDGQGTSQSGDIATAGGTLTESMPWFMTARGRIGYTITPTMMLYGTGGAAVIDVKSSGAGLSQDDTRLGWTAGAGVEGMLTRQWTWKLEYLHLDTGTFTPANTPGVSLHVTDEIVRGGVNWHF